jgi:hypothetical protein
MPKGKVETPITDQELAFALLLLAGKLTDREAAEAVGLRATNASYVKAKPRVKEYMEKHRASVAAAIVQHESEVLAESNIGREQIMLRYWEIARLSPAETNGNVTGQVRALDSVRDMLGFVGPKVVEQSEPETHLDIYQAKWMRKPGDPGYEDDEEETAGSREASTPPEPVMSDPEPPPEPARIERSSAVLTQSPTVHPTRFTRKRVGEPAEPPRLVSGGAFGRFQGM